MADASRRGKIPTTHLLKTCLRAADRRQGGVRFNRPPMAKLFISLSGEGRGHATRVRALVEVLAPEHEIHVFAPGDAHAFLGPLYAGTSVRVHELPGLRFGYDASERLNYLQTARELLAYLRSLPRTIKTLSERLRREQPDLVITDFEPALPRAARQCGCPFLSVDHQHFLRICDLRQLPLSLRWRAAYLAVAVGAYYRGQAETIVSSFYFPPLRRGLAGVTQVGVLLRQAVRQARPRLGSHLAAYWRRAVPEAVLAVLEQTGLQTRVYGLGARPARGRVSFHPISETAFLEDLASCTALLCTAGNQVIGEALYLGKPVFALAETGNFEQAINAFFLRASGAGDALWMEEFSAARLHLFLARLERYRARIRPDRLDGLPEVLAILRRYLFSPSLSRSWGRLFPQTEHPVVA